MKIVLGDFNAKVEREDIFRPTIGKYNLHSENNENAMVCSLSYISHFTGQAFNVTG